MTTHTVTLQTIGGFFLHPDTNELYRCSTTPECISAILSGTPWAPVETVEGSKFPEPGEYVQLSTPEMTLTIYGRVKDAYNHEAFFLYECGVIELEDDIIGVNHINGRTVHIKGGNITEHLLEEEE